MKFNPEFTRELIGSTEADAVRALRPGGPLDTTLYAAKCLQCHTLVNRPLRWFHNRDWRCSCGGDFDTTSFLEVCKERLLDYLMRTKSLAELAQLLEELSESNRQ